MGKWSKIFIIIASVLVAIPIIIIIYVDITWDGTVTSRRANVSRIEHLTGLIIPDEVEFLWGSFAPGFGGVPSQFVIFDACEDLSWLASQIDLTTSNNSSLNSIEILMSLVDSTVSLRDPPIQYRPIWSSEFSWKIIPETFGFFIIHFHDARLLMFGVLGY